MIREEALSFASCIAKALAEAKGHTHFLKTFASFMRRYSRDEDSFENANAFLYEVVREYQEYLSNLCVSIEQLREGVKEYFFVNEEEKILLVVEINAVLFALRKVYESVDKAESPLVIPVVETILQETISYIPTIPTDWVVSKKGTSLVVKRLNLKKSS
ncbi:hypothetical protein [Alkalicoccobacillus gibsonii]|uniref:hypothetical protein n=1 Tax=Alkalicoccobacillus gibsonii TaxID=79881 RepID=UPI00193207AE|nr:hypothetical protein [Alkalicoccobacillus gibsonii]MBM0066028.1 hypothetical protein [Alkalicoccobacillus gibsonii]